MILELAAEYEQKLPRNNTGVRFSFSHVVLALFLFDLHGKMGRVEMEHQLALGRGSLRTFMARLKDSLDLVESTSTRAHVLSNHGRETIDAIKNELALVGNIPVIFDELKFASFNAIARLASRPRLADRMHYVEPMKLVDAAKASGGAGLISVVVQAERSLKLLGVPMDLKKQYASEWVRLNEIFALREGDLLIIAWAGSELDAKLAAIAAAVEAAKMLKE